ncbi:MAG: polysaccharide biosynthesis tyrosine autokinase [Chloroflexi bacterium]|nr:polysaccharide biosynthesis tyrosine autokinase [Chloroflexota bacterium]
MEEQNYTESTHYLLGIARWWWLVAIAIGVAVLLLWAPSASNAATTYTATTRVMVLQVQGASVSFDDPYIGERLARLYERLIMEDEIQSEVARELNLDQHPGAVVRARAVAKEPLLDVIATHPDPVLAAAIANTTLRVFIDHFRSQRLNEVARLQAMANSLGIDDRGLFLSQELAATGSFVVAKSAVPPTVPDPVARRGIKGLVLSALLGLVVGGALGFGLEFLLDRVRSPERLRLVSGRKPLGVVPAWSASKRLRYVPIILRRPHTKNAEAYRRTAFVLHSKLSQSGAGGRSLMVTSASGSEGKSTTAVNLSIALAQTGSKVLLIDGDMWRPALHRWFALDRSPGLSDLIIEGEERLAGVIQPTNIENLRVIPGGTTSADHSSLLSRDRVRQVVARLQKEADICIFDTPPVLGTSFPSLLAPFVDHTILVAHAQITTGHSLRAALEMIEASEGPRTSNNIEVVLNSFKYSKPEYYVYYWRQASGYKRYYGVYSEEAVKKASQSAKR